MPHDSHDSLVKATFTRLDFAADEFRAVLPSALVARLDLDELTLCPGSFVSDELRQQHTDLLFSAPLDGEPAFLYLLLEHQSTVDRMMPLRLLRYMVSIWERHLGEHADATTLPPILPVVLHHSEKGWTTPTSFGELFALSDGAREAFGPYLPELRFVLDDLSRQPDEALQMRQMAAQAKLTLWALKNARHAQDVLASLAAWRDILREAVTAPGGIEALAAIVRYTLQHADTDPDALKRFLIDSAGDPAKEAFMTGAEKLTQAVREQSLRQGRVEGRVEGRAEALRAVLTKMLEERFGELPREFRSRIEQAEAERLERWAVRCATAREFEQIFSVE
ncbi:Rpn family recombination-promoting nuclease/putative transposase [Haliangium ochraceum]|uniref:Putative transposase n=1 Tax=Haliangium ochraceum (strain DSM 14365 / JCM 11303 / SMP-2) TaxID=502025 RepID=D0LPQ9_HALO1|nr:Rpn family recombination-promoting nuclease/putative transposase [Haliangium ochraceum]ACY15422.1 putative transposase [Haliangium ochraceum DSM 14365]